MSLSDLLFVGGAALIGATGLYMMAAPRRLFTRAEDPARFRPEAVEYDSSQGVWLRKVQGPAMIAVAVGALLFHFL
jgi:hypothetical protein